MAVIDDSRPFVVLQKSADDFKNRFDENIKTCINLLDSKLSSLISDPDSIGSPSKEARRLSAHLEFTKAKYEIFMTMSEMIEEMETSWKEQLEDMRTSFLENVEILLASTKLETKTPPGDKKSSSTLKNRKGLTESSSSPSTTSLYPFSLLNTAKRIPVLNSFLSNDEESEKGDKEHGTSISRFQENAKKSRNIRESPLPSNKNIVVHKHIVTVGEEEETSESDELVETTPPKRDGRGRPRKATLPEPTTKAEYAMVHKNIVTDEEEEETSESDEDNELVEKMPSKRDGRGRPRKATIPEPTTKTEYAGKQSLGKKTTATVAPKSGSRRLADQKISSSKIAVKRTEESKLHTTPSRSTRKRTAVKEATQTGFENEMEWNENIQDITAATPKTPKNVHFSVGLDVHEDLDVYSPDISLTKSAPRRKTIITDVMESFNDVSLTPDIVRSKAKRKTIAGSAMDVTAAPSPKRFKKGGRISMALPTMDEEKSEEESDLSESDASTEAEHYTNWLPLDNLDGKVPTQPGIYELKVYKAKKSAYIGSCDNLRHKLTLHKLGQTSGHKHLDKFLERNKKDVQVRYEKMPSAAQAKNEEMKRIKNFVTQHKTTPAYN